eukprot:TRINITY_DN19954_c0_g2_i2.p1 TRINITY_DN19954_c0_g2~~TRINITY_DN19954_c0_g2_i2.p1  ORF type:complete len:280 (+),score=97.99 TRINITY_DN19954_c0_g2_i2:85-840(+)
MRAGRNALLAAGAAALGWCAIRLCNFLQQDDAEDAGELRGDGGNAADEAWRDAPWVQRQMNIPAGDPDDGDEDLGYDDDELPNDRAARLLRLAATARQEDNNVEDKAEDDADDFEDVDNHDDEEMNEGVERVDLNEAQEVLVFDDALYEMEFSNDAAVRHPGFVPGHHNPYAEEWHRRRANAQPAAQAGEMPLMRDNYGQELPDPNRNPHYNEEHARLIDLLHRMDAPVNAAGPPQLPPPVEVVRRRPGGR